MINKKQYKNNQQIIVCIYKKNYNKKKKTFRELTQKTFKLENMCFHVCKIYVGLCERVQKVKTKNNENERALVGDTFFPMCDSILQPEALKKNREKNVHILQA